MEYHLLEDLELTSLVASGDQRALAALYDRHASRVFSLALSLLGNYSDAEEVTQDVIMSVWQNSGTYDPLKARFSTWITRIAHNRAVDELRRRRRRADESRLEDHEIARPDTTEAGIEYETVRSALFDLSEEQRKVVYLGFFQGYTHTEIARMLDRPLGTVKTQMRSALRLLRDRVTASAEEVL